MPDMPRARDLPGETWAVLCEVREVLERIAEVLSTIAANTEPKSPAKKK